MPKVQLILKKSLSSSIFEVKSCLRLFSIGRRMQCASLKEDWKHSAGGSQKSTFVNYSSGKDTAQTSASLSKCNVELTSAKRAEI